jgi:SAM-dependent methyltransferase
MITWVRQRYRAAEFNPRLLGIATNPFYFARKELRAELQRLAPSVKGRLLDVGCGQMPYRELFSVSEYLGLEIDREENRITKCADFFYDGSTMPFETSAFDSVLCNQVLEHVFSPREFLDELHRVMRPGGSLILTVPFVWDEHEAPWDFARYTTFGLRHLLERAGFDVIEQRRTCADARALFQLVNAYLFRALHSRHRWLNALSALMFMAPANALGELLWRVLPSNSAFFLDQVVLAHRRPDAKQ